MNYVLFLCMRHAVGGMMPQPVVCAVALIASSELQHQQAAGVCINQAQAVHEIYQASSFKYSAPLLLLLLLLCLRAGPGWHRYLRHSNPGELVVQHILL
jgi:hypothetical protein